MSSVDWANNLRFFSSFAFFFFFYPSLHLQLCRQLSPNISHWSLWVSSQVEGAPIGFPTASYPHTSKGSPLSVANQSPQVLAAITVSETQKKRVHLNTVPGCSEMQNAGIGKKRRVPLLEGRPVLLFPLIWWMIKPQRKIQVKCLEDNGFSLPNTAGLLVEYSQSYSHINYTI